MSLEKIHREFRALVVRNGDRVGRIYFSYSTPVAVETEGIVYVAKNAWSKTTGKHLNMLKMGKTDRLPPSMIEELAIEMLQEVLGNDTV